MPGQEPYTPEEWKTVSRLVAVAAHVTEALTSEETDEWEREIERDQRKKHAQDNS